VFAICDFETSGFSPAQHRVLEIAVVRVRRDGGVEDRWSTLVDPGTGDVGPTHVHGISRSGLLPAPRFSEIAGEFVARLEGAVFVAHNASFEEGLLTAELSRLGVSLPPMPAVCTFRTAQARLGLPGNRLVDVAAAYGVTIRDAHTAMGDVEAIRDFLPRLLSAAGPLTVPVGLPTLPRLPTGCAPHPRRSRASSGPATRTATSAPRPQVSAAPAVGRTYRCGLCGAPGHNRRTCPRRYAA
jgi:DNA polymerase-3 subunit epsilon